MTSDGPGLRAVPDPPPDPTPAPEVPAAPGRSGSWLKIALLLGLVAAVLGYRYEDQRARALEERVGVLQEELKDARRQLQANEERMQVVRGYVDDLVGRVGLLQQAVAPEPPDGPPEQPPALPVQPPARVE